MHSEVCTFLLGYTKSGKTTLGHSLSSSNLSIRNVGSRGYAITVEDQVNEHRLIGNRGDSCTKYPQYYCEEQICDFPGLVDTRGLDFDITNLISLFNKIQMHKYIRIAICVEQANEQGINAGQFSILTKEIISLLNLSEEDLSGICLIVTKSSQSYLEEIANDFKELFPNRKDFIIEAIKNQTIEIKGFETPIDTGSGYKFNESNIEEIKQTLLDRPYINSLFLQINIKKHIRIKVNDIIERNSNTRIVFVSSLQGEQLREILGDIVCIDEDINIKGETLIIQAPIILVLLNENSVEKRKITITGINPTVTFKDVESVFDGINLIIVAKSSQRIEFPKPTEERFERDEHFFRIESLCINGNFTEYATFNNMYLDLIAYINPDVGKIDVDPKFHIRTDTTCIELRLYVNECTRSKNNIAKRFKSLKMCKDVDEYLDGRKGNPRLKTILLLYAINLPSIFQLLIKDFYRFCSTENDATSLFEIRDFLISNYMTLMSNYIENRILIKSENNNLFDKALDNFLSEFNSTREKFKNDKTQIIDKIIRYLNANDTKKINAFYQFYDLLSIKEEKVELFKHKITADMSIYPNFYAAIQLHNSGIIIIDAYDVNISYFVLQLGARLALGAAIRGVATLVAEVALAGFAGVLVGAISIAINPIIAKIKSGYYKGEMMINGYELRLDCLLRLE